MSEKKFIIPVDVIVKAESRDEAIRELHSCLEGRRPYLILDYYTHYDKIEEAKKGRR